MQAFRIIGRIAGGGELLLRDLPFENGERVAVSVEPLEEWVGHVEADVSIEADGCVPLRFPRAVDARLHALLDKQDSGEPLTEDERQEAEGLVEIAEFLSFLRLQAERRAATAR